jgi:hypothetical protein
MANDEAALPGIAGEEQVIRLQSQELVSLDAGISEEQDESMPRGVRGRSGHHVS